MRASSHGTAALPEFVFIEASWEARWTSLCESVAALAHGRWPVSSQKSPLYLETNWIGNEDSQKALVASVCLHAMAIILAFSISPAASIVAEHSAEKARNYELTWYPMRALPHLSPRRGTGHSRNLRRDTVAMPQEGTLAYNPRQTIISDPKVVTHPLQTLVRPDVPLTPPKILPPLPNVVQWSEGSQPQQPAVNLKMTNHAPSLPQERKQNLQTPDIRAEQTQQGTFVFAERAPEIPRPRLPVLPKSGRPDQPVVNHTEPVAAPQITVELKSAGDQNWIALSAQPASVPPPPIPPAGNLAANFAASPEGTRPGAPNGATNGMRAEADLTARGASGKGPEGIMISGGVPNGTASGAPAAGPLGYAARALLINPGTNPLHVMPGGVLPPDSASERRTAAANPPAKPAKLLQEPGEILHTPRFYTLFVNMPNLTSASGSWVLDFAELNADGSVADRSDDLSGPEPVHKVDPKYPPALVKAHVEGDVMLFAIIRKDGTVDSVQLIKGIDPVLDRNAMEALSQWRFLPARKNNEPVDLEAVVRIPFRSVPPL